MLRDAFASGGASADDETFLNLDLSVHIIG